MKLHLSGVAHFVDPCNALPSQKCWGKDWLWFQKVLEGEWVVTHSAEFITATHVDYTHDPIPLKKLGTIGVDSGMLGIFDATTYPHYDTPAREYWYQMVCDMGNDETFASGENLPNNNYVTGTQYGDGSYRVWAAKDENKRIVAVRIEL